MWPSPASKRQGSRYTLKAGSDFRSGCSDPAQVQWQRSSRRKASTASWGELTSRCGALLSLWPCTSDTNLWTFRAPSKISARNKARQAFLALGDAFPIFPSPQGCDKHGAKVPFNATLGKISREMGMRRPESTELVDLENPPSGLVLKREYSDTGRDVYIPSLQLKLPRDQGTREAAAFIKERMTANKNDNCLWLCQELAPFLPIGEVRFMCVGGAPIREVVTGRHPQNHPTAPHQMWSYERNDSLKTISALQ
jgi:hypothetical protein